MNQKATTEMQHTTATEDEFFVPVYINRPLFKELGAFMREMQVEDVNEALAIVFEEFQNGYLAERRERTPDCMIKLWMQNGENGPLSDIDKAIERQNLAALYPEEAKRHGLRLR